MAAETARLPLPTLFRLALRNVGRNKIRSALSLAAIATGVAGLILSGGFVNDLIFRLGEALIHSQSGHAQVARAGYFDSGSRSPGKYLMTPEDLRALQRGSVPHVAATMRRIGFAGLVNNGRSSYPIYAEGIEPDLEAKLGTYMVLVDGRGLSSADSYGALVGAGVARAMDLKPGSVINLLASTIDESMNTVQLEVVGVFQSFSKDYDDRIVKLPLGAAQELLDTKGVNILVLLLDSTLHTMEVASRLAPIVSTLGLEVRTWDVLNDFYGKTVELYDRQFGILQLIVLLMVLLAVAGAINISVNERAGEFGTMRALGNRAADVRRLVIIEAAVTGLAGALTGAALGYALAWWLSRVGIPMPPPPNSNLEFTARIQLSTGVVLGAAFIGFVATVIAALPASVRIARLPVAEALRRVV